MCFSSHECFLLSFHNENTINSQREWDNDIPRWKRIQSTIVQISRNQWCLGSIMDGSAVPKDALSSSQRVREGGRTTDSQSEAMEVPIPSASHQPHSTRSSHKTGWAPWNDAEKVLQKLKGTIWYSVVSYHNPWNYCFKNYRCFLPIWFTHMRFHLLYLWKENAFWSPRYLSPGCWQAAAGFGFSCSAHRHCARQHLPFPWWKWKRKVIEEKSIMGKLRTDFSLLFKIISKRLELHALSLNKCK